MSTFTVRGICLQILVSNRIEYISGEDVHGRHASHGVIRIQYGSQQVERVVRLRFLKSAKKLDLIGGLKPNTLLCILKG